MILFDIEIILLRQESQIDSGNFKQEGKVCNKRDKDTPASQTTPAGHTHAHLAPIAPIPVQAFYG